MRAFSSPPEQGTGRMDKNIMVAIDIGSQLIKVLIVEVGSDSKLRVVGVGRETSDGMRRGSVVNVDKAVRAIQKAVKEAVDMSGVEVKQAWVNISGRHLMSINGRATIAVTNNAEITEADVRRAINHAEVFNFPADRIPLHTFPKDFTVDNQPGIIDPVGMSGSKIESLVHVVSAAVSAKETLVRCVEKAGIHPLNLLPDSIASAYAVLDKDDREIGVAVIDIGSATTDISVYYSNSLHYTASIDLGGDHITNDLLITLRLTQTQAEELKKKEGTCFVAEVNDRYITLPGKTAQNGETRDTPRSFIAKVIEARVYEIFEICKREMQQEGFFLDARSPAISRIRLTGGTSLLEGIERVAYQVFNAEQQFVDDVSVVWPTGLGGLSEQVCSPMHSVGVGLIQFGLTEIDRTQANSSKSSSGGGLIEMIKKFFHYLKANF